MKISAKAILSAPTVHHVSLCDDQRVFIVGDLDGNLRQLENALERVNFDSTVDQLVSLGDVIDRGDDSVELLSYLKKLGALMVLGNHEHIMIESIIGSDEEAEGVWNKNGGQWHKLISDKSLISHCQWLLEQPLSLVIDYRRHKIGLSHTLPTAWDWQNLPTDKSKVVAALLWDRELFKRGKGLVNHGVDFSIHGHNSTQIPIWIDNSYHIDTSFYGRPTVVELKAIIEKLV